MQGNVRHEGIRLNSFAVKNGVTQWCDQAIRTGNTQNCPVSYIFCKVTGVATSD